jgi:hypothetical protein
MADSDIIVSLHLVIPFISTGVECKWSKSLLSCQMSKYPFGISGMFNILHNFVYVKCKLLKSHSNRFIHSVSCDNRGQCFKTFLSVIYEFS